MFTRKLKRKIRRLFMSPANRKLEDEIAKQMVLNAISELAKALEAGLYDAAPTRLEQGCRCYQFKVESLEDALAPVTFEQGNVKLQR